MTFVSKRKIQVLQNAASYKKHVMWTFCEHGYGVKVSELVAEKATCFFKFRDNNTAHIAGKSIFDRSISNFAPNTQRFYYMQFIGRKISN